MQCDQREGWMGRSESKDLFKKIGLKKNDHRQSSENDRRCVRGWPGPGPDGAGHQARTGGGDLTAYNNSVSRSSRCCGAACCSGHDVVLCFTAVAAIMIH